MGVGEVTEVERSTGHELISESDHQRIDSLEEWMIANGHAVEQPLTHNFTPGIYARTIFNPAGSLIVTKIHKIDHPFVLLKGKLRIMMPGQQIETITAPHFGITRAGTRRVIYAIEDSVFITFHPNPDDERDLDTLEERLVESRPLSDGRTAYEHYREMLDGAIDGAITAPREVAP